MTQQTEQQGPIWLTQKAFDELTAELEDMKGPRAPGASSPGSAPPATRATSARTAATTPPARSRASSRARSASSSTCCCTPRPRSPADDGVVAAGKVVTYKFEGDKDDEAETILLGARENEEYVDGLTVFSPQSPLGAALLGAETGRRVEFTRPQRQHQQGRGRLDAVPYKD